MVVSIRSKFIQSVSIGGILLLAVHFASAAPLCSEVLLTTKLISAEKISQAISQLALMKMESDLATIKGSSSLTALQIPMDGLYQKKFQELIFKLHDQETAESLQSKIKAEVVKIQNEKTEEVTLETKERKIEVANIPDYRKLEYSIESHTPIDWFVGNMLYHTTTDSVLLNHKTGSLKRLVLATEEIIPISENAFSAKILKDEEHVLSFSNEGLIQIHRIDSGQLTSSTRTTINLSHLKFNAGGFSPDNTRLAAAYQDKIAVIDVQTGSEIIQIQKKDLLDSASDIAHVEFIDNDSLLIRIPTDKRFVHQLIRFDLNSKTHQSVEISDKAGLAFSSDRRTIFTAHSETVLFRSSDLSEISRMSTRGLESKNGNTILSVPGSDLQLVSSKERTGRPFAYLADVGTDITSPTFTFSLTYYLHPKLPSLFPSHAVFSNDGKVLLVISERIAPKTGISNFTLDKWIIK